MIRSNHLHSKVSPKVQFPYTAQKVRQGKRWKKVATKVQFPQTARVATRVSCLGAVSIRTAMGAVSFRPGHGPSFYSHDSQKLYKSRMHVLTWHAWAMAFYVHPLENWSLRERHGTNFSVFESRQCSGKSWKQPK